MPKETASRRDASETTEGATLFEIHHGLVTRLVVYGEKTRALVDLGLEG